MDEVLSTLVILLSVASSSASLGYWLAKQFERINAKLRAIEAGLDGLEMGIYGFNELLLKVLEAKGVLSRTGAIALVSALRGLIPGSRSKYYTREVESRLREILSKDPDSFTMDDVEELMEIARLMEKEYMVSGRRELLDYAVKLRIGALVIKVVLVEPKTRGLEEWLFGSLGAGESSSREAARAGG